MEGNVMKALVYYLKVLSLIIKNNFSSQSQYRASVLIRFIGTFAELLFTILFFTFIYNKILFINGWYYKEILILIFIYDIARNIILGCLVRNLPKLEDLIINGKFDFYLTKPIDPQFFLSLNYMSLGHLTQALIPLGLLIYTLNTGQNFNVNFFSYFLLLFNIIQGIIIAYSLWIFIMSFSFYVIKIKSLHEIYLHLLQLGKYPSSIYGRIIKFILSFIFPILFVASLPTEIFLGFSSIWSTLILTLIAFFTFTISRFSWKRGIQYYESAGG
jgi:ABC-2 type transport system permease protein